MIVFNYPFDVSVYVQTQAPDISHAMCLMRLGCIHIDTHAITNAWFTVAHLFGRHADQTTRPSVLRQSTHKMLAEYVVAKNTTLKNCVVRRVLLILSCVMFNVCTHRTRVRTHTMVVAGKRLTASTAFSVHNFVTL